MIAGCALPMDLATSESTSSRAKRIDAWSFESDVLGGIPPGFIAESGEWAVADSPTATSGLQVLAGFGREVAVIDLTTTPARDVRAEVAVRVFSGAGGAGLRCDSGTGTTYALAAEPERERIALYRELEGERSLLSSSRADVVKGEWFRLSIVCTPDRIEGGVQGKRSVRGAPETEGARVALVASAGVVAQFDDLRIVTMDE